MGHKRQRNKNKKLKKRVNTNLHREYYHEAFYYLHNELFSSNFELISTPKECQVYWKSVIPPGTYENLQAYDILSRYSGIVEEHLASKINKQSLTYWIHLYRRISPDVVGGVTDSQTTMIVRSILEAAFQKYGRYEYCDKIGWSNDIPIGKVLNGFLLHPSLGPIREYVQTTPQLVLTDFTLNDLKELYIIERFALEIWKVTASMRAIGKGANLIVLEKEPFYTEGRDDELDKLIKYYDSRPDTFNSSLSGVVFDSRDYENNPNVFIPYYNVAKDGISPGVMAIAEKTHSKIPENFIPNLLLNLFPIKDYYDSHYFFKDEFFKKYNLELPHVFAFLGAILTRMIFLCMQDTSYLIKMLQRGYEGPNTRVFMITEISQHLSDSNKYLGFVEDVNNLDLDKLFNFFTVQENQRENIDISMGGPMKIFLPADSHRYFLDLAWINQILYSFFWGLNPSDQNFKGDILEKIVNKNKSILTTKPCKSVSGTSKQIDASYEKQDFLFIVECKAKGQSFAFEKGTFQSLSLRKQFITEALEEVDTKAQWLIDNPVGSNFNVSHYKAIIPILITPFKEYIPSLNHFYWLNRDQARVFTFSEFDEFLSKVSIEEMNTFYNVYWNKDFLII
jgi:hypothetical protein